MNMFDWDGSTVVTNPPALYALFPDDKIILYGKWGVRLNIILLTSIIFDPII